MLASGPTLAVSFDATFNSGSANALMDYWDISRTGAGLPFSLTHIPNGKYDLYLYGANGSFNDGRGTTFTVTGVGTLSDTTTNASHGDQAFVNGDNYVVFPGIVINGVGGFGSLSGLYTWNTAGSSQGEGNFNGLQLVALVPEPSSVLLFGLGAIGLCVAAWRRRSIGPAAPLRRAGREVKTVIAAAIGRKRIELPHGPIAADNRSPSRGFISNTLDTASLLSRCRSAGGAAGIYRVTVRYGPRRAVAAGPRLDTWLVRLATRADLQRGTGAARQISGWLRSTES